MKLLLVFLWFLTNALADNSLYDSIIKSQKIDMESMQMQDEVDKLKKILS